MQHLGTYGATAPDEMVAELAAALQGGRQLNPDLAGVLQHYGGPQMFQRLGDMGLLKAWASAFWVHLEWEPRTKKTGCDHGWP